MLAEDLLAVVLQTKAEQVPPPSLVWLDEQLDLRDHLRVDDDDPRGRQFALRICIVDHLVQAPGRVRVQADPVVTGARLCSHQEEGLAVGKRHLHSRRIHSAGAGERMDALAEGVSPLGGDRHDHEANAAGLLVAESEYIKRGLRRVCAMSNAPRRRALDV